MKIAAVNLVHFSPLIHSLFTSFLLQNNTFYRKYAFIYSGKTTFSSITLQGRITTFWVTKNFFSYLDFYRVCYGNVFVVIYRINPYYRFPIHNLGKKRKEKINIFFFFLEKVYGKKNETHFLWHETEIGDIKFLVLDFYFYWTSIQA